jgi:nucleotide sugar dehydrogenase
MSMTMTLERNDIDTPEKRRTYTVSVVGCGRMGLPHACLFAEAGFKVIGVDPDQRVVGLMKRGRASFAEPELNALVKRHVKNGRLTVTGDARKAVSTSDVIVFVVPIPIDRKKKPNYFRLEKACKDVGMGLRSGSLVIFASAMCPGVTETLVKETLESASGLKAGVDFGLAYSPIRAAPGRMLQDIANCSRVVSAVGERSMNAACLFLSTIVKGEIIRVRDIKTAEAVKLFENVYKDVNTALVNEFAQFCEKAGIDFVEVQKAANTHPECSLLSSKIVGGHVSRDSYLLLDEADAVNVKLRMLTLARKINDEMLGRTLHLVKDALKSCGKTMRKAKISVFGVSCCPNIKEPRGSSIKKLVSMLSKKGALVKVYDPFFSHKELIEMGYSAERTLTQTVEGVDCLVIIIGHDRFRRLNLRKIKFLVKKPAAIVDMGQVIGPQKAEREGFVYRGVGRGVWTR